ncbi:hypothetical protein Bca101_036824 [Brassica carinata]
MPSSTRTNKKKHLLFSEDPAHLERTIRKDQRSTSLDAAAFTLTDSRTHPSTDTRPSSSTDIHHSTSHLHHRSIDVTNVDVMLMKAMAPESSDGNRRTNMVSTEMSLDMQEA